MNVDGNIQYRHKLYEMFSRQRIEWKYPHALTHRLVWSALVQQVASDCNTLACSSNTHSSLVSYFYKQPYLSTATRLWAKNSNTLSNAFAWQVRVKKKKTNPLSLSSRLSLPSSCCSMSNGHCYMMRGFRYHIPKVRSALQLFIECTCLATSFLK